MLTSARPKPPPDGTPERILWNFQRELEREELHCTKRERCRADFNAFQQYLLRDKRGTPLPVSAYSLLLGDTLTWAWNNQKHLGHMAPQGLGKSTIIGAFLIWLLGRDPTLATVVISAEAAPAERRVGLCRKMILQSQYRRIFPEIEPDVHRGEFKKPGGGLDIQGWQCSAFYFRNAVQSNDPAMSASAAVPKTEARRVNALLGDDLMSRTVAASAAMKREMIDATMDTWLYGRLSNGGWACLTHNCWDRTDLLHTLRDDTRFVHLWAGVDPDGPLDRMFVWLKGFPPDFPLLAAPEKYSAVLIETPAEWEHAFSIPLPPGRKEWTPEHLASLRDNPKTAAAFAQFHGLRAQSPEDLMFPTWASRAQSEGVAGAALGLTPAGQGFVAGDNLARMKYVFTAGLDLSGTGRDGTVLTVLARDSARRIHPIFHRRYRDVLEAIADVQRLWDGGIQFNRLAVENNGVQSQIVSTMKADAAARKYAWAGRVHGVHTGNQKMNPENGLPAIDAMIRAGEFVWPAGETSNPANPKAADWRRWEREMGTVTRSEVSSKGRTPDSLMSFWFAKVPMDGLISVKGGAPAAGVPAVPEFRGVNF